MISEGEIIDFPVVVVTGMAFQYFKSIGERLERDESAVIAIIPQAETKMAGTGAEIRGSSRGS